MGKVKLVHKPWGHEEIWAITDSYVGKLLYIKSGHRLSRQYHQVKEETIRVLDGVLTVETEADGVFRFQQLKEGEVFHVTPRTVHRFGAENGDVRLVEVSTPEIDDIIRLEDDYKRAQ